jgi:tetratricopeptide (TPR) repeat protein
MRSDPERARELLTEGLGLYPESASLVYGLACLEAVQGRRDAALTALRQAVEAAPDAAVWARDDEDFAALRDDPEFRSLLDR